MGMIPMIWTSAPNGATFDTFGKYFDRTVVPSIDPIVSDWRVPGGLVTGVTQYKQFQSILGNASTMNTGYVMSKRITT